MTAFNPDWYADSHEHGRDLAWYVERAKAGDQRAAQRALQLIVGTLTPEGQRQNGGLLDPALARVVHELLSPLAEGHASPVLDVAVKGPPNRRVDESKRGRVWWACVDMHGRLAANPGMSRAAAATATLADDEWCEPASLVKEYKGLEHAVAAYLRAADSLASDAD